MSSSADKKPADDETTTAAASSSSAEKKPADGEIAAAATSASAEGEEKVVLRTSDGGEFAVEVRVARKLGMISNMIDDDCVGGGVALPDIESRVLSRVLEYVGRKAAAGGGEESKEFEVEYFKRLADKEALFEVIQAANFLEAQELLDASCQCAGDRIKGKTVQEIRDYFGIVNDFTPKEEEEIRKENEWAFD